jgi:hypothetical protein
MHESLELKFQATPDAMMMPLRSEVVLIVAGHPGVSESTFIEDSIDNQRTVVAALHSDRHLGSDWDLAVIPSNGHQLASGWSSRNEDPTYPVRDMDGGCSVSVDHTKKTDNPSTALSTIDCSVEGVPDLF